MVGSCAEFVYQTPHDHGLIRILGIDPGLRNTGWGMIDAAGARLSFVASGSMRSDRRPARRAAALDPRGLGGAHRRSRERRRSRRLSSTAIRSPR